MSCSLILLIGGSKLSYWCRLPRRALCIKPSAATRQPSAQADNMCLSSQSRCEESTGSCSESLTDNKFNKDPRWGAAGCFTSIVTQGMKAGDEETPEEQLEISLPKRDQSRSRLRCSNTERTRRGHVDSSKPSSVSEAPTSC